MSDKHSDFIREAVDPNDPLIDNEDAIECAACHNLYIPPKEDGILIVHVLRVEGDPPGTPGVAVCEQCRQMFNETGILQRDKVVVH